MSIVFATLFENKLHGQICANNGADGNVTDGRTLHAIEGTGADVEVERLNSPLVFEIVAATSDGRRTTLMCTKTTCINTKLKTRHGSALVLRNLRWLITEQPLSDSLLGCPLLEALEQRTGAVLAAAADRFAGSIDA